MTLVKRIAAIVLSIIWCSIFILWIKAGHDWANEQYQRTGVDNTPEAYYP